jgi:hypothetical protein
LGAIDYGEIMRAYWRLGYPGWRVAAKLGLPIKITIDVYHDDEAAVYFATSDDIGLAVEAESLDGLIKEIHSALEVLLSLAHSPISKPRTEIRIHDNLVFA